MVKGLVIVNKLFWVCDSFFNWFEFELYCIIINIYVFQMMIELLLDELIQWISLICGVYSDICLVIDYYWVINENCLLFGVVIFFVECIFGDFKVWNCKLMLKIFFYLEYVCIDFVWGGLMVCSVNLFLQIGSFLGWFNVFFVQGYFGFGVIFSYIVCKVFVEGMSEGLVCYDLFSLVCCILIYGKDYFCLLLFSVGKIWYQFFGYWNGWC